VFAFFGRWIRRLVFACFALLLLVVLCILAMRWINPFGSAFMLESSIAAIGESPTYHTHYRWVSLEDISPHAAIAVIAAEDQLFPFHTGFDFKSIREAVQHNNLHKRQHGASTISQQVAKNLFLWPGGGYFRKSLEAGITLLIEWMWPKERILEMYLNIAEFGRGVYGVEAAAQQFYGRPARRLNREQAAMLAAVLPNPRRYRVESPSRFVVARRDWILVQMAGLGGTRYLDQLDKAQGEPPRLPRRSAR
jgi:monofunctional biosynthetic peptidoglycan transglycosylase